MFLLTGFSTQQFKQLNVIPKHCNHRIEYHKGCLTKKMEIFVSCYGDNTRRQGRKERGCSGWVGGRGTSDHQSSLLVIFCNQCGSKMANWFHASLMLRCLRMITDKQSCHSCGNVRCDEHVAFNWLCIAWWHHRSTALIRSFFSSF